MVSLKTILHNLHLFFINDERETIKTINYLYKTLSDLENKVCLQEDRINSLFVNLMVMAPEVYKQEANYVLRHGLTNFPYNQIKEMEQVEYGFDNQKQLPYVVHNSKRLYFPHSYPLDFCQRMYISYISEECLLGGNYREHAPHQYQTEKFKIEEEDILVDVGCAEALLSLDSIEKVAKVYLLEADPIWIPALEATFENYKEKVEIINKYVSDEDTENTITLGSLLKNERDKKMFVKMDIEGSEVSVLKGSLDFLKGCSNLKIACCTYHREHDAEEIVALFNDMALNYEFSDGYMLFLGDTIKYPYFRRGLLRGWK